MKKTFKKTIAATVSAAIIAGSSLGVINASATTIGNNAVSGSAFTYNAVTEKVTYNGNPNAIKLTIRTVNNPGVNLLSYGVTYSGNYEAVAQTMTNCGANGTVINAAENKVFVSCLCGAAYSDVIESCIWFMPNSGVTSSSMNLQINVGLCAYRSTVENIDVTLPELYPVDTHVPVSSTYGLMLGDARHNNNIDIYDAYRVLEIVNYNNSLYSSGKSGYVNGRISVNNLNSYFSSNRDSWYTKYGEMEYAEIADVDYDGYITEDDSNDILIYSSNKAVGNIDEDSSIGNMIYLNVVD